MKSKNIALVLSTVLLTNTVGFSAHAYNQAQAVKIDESLIDQSLSAQSKEMERNLLQVTALIKSIETYRTTSQGEKQNAFVNAARLMITILGLGSTAIHMKNVQAQSSIELTLAAVAGVLSTALEKYVSTQKIDMNEVRDLLTKNQQDLVNSISGAVSKEDAALISGAVAQIAQINSELDSRMNDIKRTIDSGQTDLAIVAVVTLALNYAAPFLPKKLKEVVSNKAPTMLGHAAKTKKQGMQALGSTNIATLLSTVAGMAGKDSQAQLDAILSNLRVTQANLKASLK
ncbi:hypothetical protein K2P97_11185 [bacterium]|nr:hypothetical protein [bacterium]